MARTLTPAEVRQILTELVHALSDGARQQPFT